MPRALLLYQNLLPQVLPEMGRFLNSDFHTALVGGLEAERDQFRGLDLSELAVNILLVSKRQSTSMVYDTRWAAFDSW